MAAIGAKKDKSTVFIKISSERPENHLIGLVWDKTHDRGSPSRMGWTYPQSQIGVPAFEYGPGSLGRGSGRPFGGYDIGHFGSEMTFLPTYAQQLHQVAPELLLP